MSGTETGRLLAFVGTYGASPGAKGGGIYTLAVHDGGRRLEPLAHSSDPGHAGYLVYAPATSTLYAADERKTDGRGPVSPPAAIHAFAVDLATGSLALRNMHPAPGPRPTYLDLSPGLNTLVCANHGDFQHVERVVRRPDGSWGCDYVYDDSTALLFALDADGGISALRDVHVFEGHGPDPNSSPQNGGHAQASSHAHCAVFDPAGRFVVVCDKGTDRIHVFEAGETLRPAAMLQMGPETGPRHFAFAPCGTLGFATCEFSSEVASFRFDPDTGAIEPIASLSSLIGPYAGRNEPAEIRVHPSGRFVYANNRGEDTLAWFSVGADGSLALAGAIALAPSLHPGLAARSFAFDPSGRVLLVADRPADLVRCYECAPDTGALALVAQHSIPDPACIAFAHVSGDVGASTEKPS